MRSSAWPHATLTRRRVVVIGTAAAAVATLPTHPALAAARAVLAPRGKAVHAAAGLPFETLHSADTMDTADELLGTGWVTSFGTTPLALPIPWATLCMSNRSWNHNLHAWHWMAPVLRAFERTGERRYLDWCVDRAVSWARTFNDGDARGTMAWYDMATGLRSYRLAFLVEQAVRHGADATKLNVLNACVYRHQVVLLTPAIFNPTTNHGFYVAAGQLAFARRLASFPRMAPVAASAQSRMRIMAVQQFAADGGHREHSPGYHWMLLTSFRGLRDAGLLTSPEVLRRVGLAEEALGWFLLPNGDLPTVGDTSTYPLCGGAARSVSPYSDFLLTRGRHGRPHPRRLKVLPEAGYAMVRSPQPTGTTDHHRSSYLLLSAGFHSRAHKHADDLSMIWFDHEREILVDAGKYGYVNHPLPSTSPLARLGFYYDAPQRQYVETTRAHNTVEADGRDHGRRGRQPYGSAIVGGQESAGHFRLQAVVNHGAWRHHREIILMPNRWLQVTDQVTALDGRDHDFRVWWNFPRELRPVPSATGRLAVHLPNSNGILWVTELGQAHTIPPRSAQRGPLRGWRSNVDLTLTPTWSTGFQAVSVRSHVFRTLFHYGRTPRTAGYSHPWS